MFSLVQNSKILCLLLMVVYVLTYMLPNDGTVSVKLTKYRIKENKEMKVKKNITKIAA